VGSPFDTPTYSAYATVDMASEALSDAEEFTSAALDAKGNAGSYTLATVMFAIVLFIAGLSRQFNVRAVTLALAAVSGVLLVAGISALILLPTLV
jgi:hypothetical protein